MDQAVCISCLSLFHSDFDDTKNMCVICNLIIQARKLLISKELKIKKLKSIVENRLILYIPKNIILNFKHESSIESILIVQNDVFS
jgi:hypothetical protein